MFRLYVHREQKTIHLVLRSDKERLTAFSTIAKTLKC